MDSYYVYSLTTCEQQEAMIDVGKFDDGKCAICHSSPQVSKSSPPCGHVFCRNCLMESCKIKKECPTCKRKFDDFFVGDDWKWRVTLHVPDEEVITDDESTESEDEDRDFSADYAQAMCDMHAILDE